MTKYWKQLATATVTLIATAAVANAAPQAGASESAPTAEQEAAASAAVNAASNEPGGQAGARQGTFEFTAGLGVKHDSNVAVLELDASSGESDSAALFDLGLAYKFALSAKATLRADYAFSHTEYQSFTDFNLSIHRGSLDFAYDFDAADAGVMLHYIDAQLDSDGFLTMKQASPYVAKLIGDRLYLRGAYTYTDKAFDGNSQRDARNDAVSADAFVFLNGVKTYLVLGYRFDAEDATDAQFDYQGTQVSAQLSHNVPVAGVDVRLRSRVRYEDRNYDEVTPAIGRKRDDERYRLDFSMALPLGKRLTATAAYEWADNRSNLPAVNFDESVWSLRLDAKI